MDASLDDGASLLTVLAAGAAFKLASLYWLNKRITRCQEKVATVTELYIYPVKSCKGIKVQSAMCGKMGLTVGDAIDRHWMICKKDKRSLALNEEPRLALVSTGLTADSLTLDAPSMETLTVPIKLPVNGQKPVICKLCAAGSPIPAYDCGQKAADWLKKFLGTDGLRLMYSAPELDKREMWKLNPYKTLDDMVVNKTVEGDQVAFSNFCAYNLLSQESLDDFHEKGGDKVISVANFRPTILVSGSKPFDEDNWYRVRIGKCLFRFLKPCHRCAVTVVDTEKGTKLKNQEPIATLKKYRLHPDYKNAPILSVQYAIDELGPIHVGDEVFVERWF